MKIYKIFVSFLLSCFVLMGCGIENDSHASSNAFDVSSTETTESFSCLPFNEPLEMFFSSGAGAWGTTLLLNPDGSFTGEYHDTDMGEMGTDYPNGIVYLSEFSGQFSEIKQLDENTWCMKLEELYLEETPDEEWIEDGVRYVATDVYGLTGGEIFEFYLPEKPVSELDFEFLSWWPDEERANKHKLDCYGLQNMQTGYGFFNYYEIMFSKIEKEVVACVKS